MRPGNLIKEPGDEFLILVPSVAWIIRYDSLRTTYKWYSALKCLKGYFLYIRQIINRMATTGSGNMGWEYRFVNLTKRQASDILYKIQKYFMINKRLRHFKADFLNQNSQLRLIMTLQVRSLSLLARGFTQKYQSIYVRSCMNLIFSNKLAY